MRPTTGLINPIHELALLLVSMTGLSFWILVSGLGGEEIDLSNDNVDICICTANKCIQGPPGLSFVLLKQDEVKRLRNIPPRSLYLNVISNCEQEQKE